MELNADKLNFILGVKVKNHRQAKGLSLKDLSEKTGLSISYLSEIEKGKKYPKLEKLILLAESLGVSFDDLVSMKIDETLDPLKEILDSEFVQGFPFHIFGIQPKEIIHIVLESPDKARALVRTFLEISRIYEVRVEHFLFAALRSFQQQHMNYFEELEEASLKFRKENSLSEQVNITLEQLQIILKDKFSYEIDETTLDSYPELQGLRSIWIKGSRPKLLINRRLMNSQKAFIIAREIGYCYLKLKERAITSSWIRVESFDQVLNTFKASYFAGSLLLQRNRFQLDIEKFFRSKVWSQEDFVEILQQYNATPEMLFYRMTEIIPKLYNFQEFFFLRLHYSPARSQHIRLNKIFNISELPIPYGTGLNETYCRRWGATKMLYNVASKNGQAKPEETEVTVQRVRFIENQQEFFLFSLSRPMALAENSFSSVTLGIKMTEEFKKHVKFWADPKIEKIDVNLTCERCPLTECLERTYPPSIYEKLEQQQRLERSLDELLRVSRSEAAT